MTMRASVIICTYNRCQSLRRTLETLSLMTVPLGLDWELLIVDNNSKDVTKQTCADFEKKLPLRYLFESKQGKSHALNFAVAEAKADLLIFSDDDVDVDSNWLASYCAADLRHPETPFFGGKIIPLWPATPPRWVEENVSGLLRGVAVWYDLGPNECPVTQQKDVFFGANLALRKKILAQESLSFRQDLGPTVGNPIRGEETYLLFQLLKRGLNGIYLPDAIVHHRNLAERMTERYVRQWYKGFGMAEVRDGKVEPGDRWLFGSPRYLWRRYLSTMVLYACTRFTRPASVWLAHECRMAILWGQICEFRQRS